MILTETLYKSVSQKLFELFFVDENKYGRQQKDGSYKLIREKVSLVTIDDMLLNHKSLLTYQEVHTLNIAFIKWICIDLDISKKEIDKNEVNKDNLESVKHSATDICNYLKKEGIPYLLEFSGKRGFHIWVIFEELQQKHVGFRLVNHILSRVTLKPGINADRFPKTSGVSKNTKRVGFGVKLPLSQNQGSNKLSFFLRETSEFSSDIKEWLTEANDLFLKEQLDIINEFHPISSDKVQLILNEPKENIIGSQQYSLSYLKGKSLNLPSTTIIPLDNILNSLKQCDHIKNLLIDYQLGLSGKERNLLVGLLGNLKNETDSELGYKYLIELFSKIKGFRKDLTEEKLKFIHYYYPVTCSQLGRCSYCSCQPIISPVELIDGVIITDKPQFSIQNITKNLFVKVREALGKYSTINDEIPLFHLLVKLDNTSHKEIIKEISKVFAGKIEPYPEVYEFKRNEGSKIRLLYSINQIDNIVSTYFLFLLNSIFYTEISDNSFGYRIAPGFHGSNIFSSWFINWASFSKNVSHIINNVEFSNYYLIKVDIKSFYDRIDLQRLRIKLYEEAPTSIKDKFNIISETDRSRYKNIVNYLIKLSQITTGNSEKGLPQGPAYGRFLAELFLLGLDKLIENELIKDKRREFYYRFVDDIFVFVENEQKAKQVLDSIDKWILLNNLELNPAKTEISKVEDYKKSGKFKRFQDDAKYSINKANRNKTLLSETEIQEALAKLGDLTNNTKFGLKDNLRFFYYQFSGDPRLNYIKDKLTTFLPFTNTGRGTLYMMFYTDLINTQPEKFWSIMKDGDRLFGLSLAHYLNTMLLNEQKIPNNIHELELFLKALEFRNDLTNADKAQVLTLSMKYELELSNQFLNSCSKSLIHSAMETPEIKYVIKDYRYIEEKLEDKDKKEFVKELYRIILKNPFDREVAEKLSKYAITRFSEWQQSTKIAELIDDEDSILEYYHSICFFSLFENSTDNTALLASWDNLLSESINIKLSKEITFNWLNRAVEHPESDFSEKSNYALLLSTKEGSPLNKYKCKNGFLKKFQDILLILLFSKEIKIENFELDAKSYIHEDSLFGKWLLDTNVRLYPAHDNICVKNLALNGVIVLENDTHLFFKKINDEGNLKAFSYLNIDKEFNNEVTILKSTEIDIYSKANDFKTYLKSINIFLENAKEFMAQYKAGYPVYYKNPYSEKGLPLIPYYSLFDQKISAFGANQPNDINSFWENIGFILQINNSDLSLILDSNNPFNFKIANLDDRFFPKSEIIIDSVEDKISFINEFIKVVGPLSINNIYSFQYFWLVTIWNTLLIKKSKSNLLEFLNIYFSSFSGAEEMPIDILFTVNERTSIQQETWKDFLLTIRTSFANFQTQVTINDFSIVELLDDEILIVNEFLNKEYTIGIEVFRKVEITFKSEFDTTLKSVKQKMYINGVLSPEKTVLAFDRDPIGFYSKSLEELAVKVRVSNVFAYESVKETLIYVPELEFSKAFKRIFDRKFLLDSIKGTTDDYNKLFPIDENYKVAEINFNMCDFSKTFDLLKNHYTSTLDIKDRVVSWLSIFNEESIAESNFKAFLIEEEIQLSKVHRALVELVNVHHRVSDEALLKFKEHVLKFSNGDYLLFPLKHPDRDKNGLYRLLQKCNFGDRVLDFEKNVRELFSANCKKNKLVILADTTISGSQAETALNHYLTLSSSESEFKTAQNNLTGKDRYFDFFTYAETASLRTNIEKMTEIIFLTPVITDEFKERMKKLELFKNKELNWIFTDELKDKTYNWGKANLDTDNERILIALMKDTILIDKLFRIPDMALYKKGLKKILELNILLRIGSLPSKHIRLFSLVPKNGFLSLFDYIHNWEA